MTWCSLLLFVSRFYCWLTPYCSINKNRHVDLDQACIACNVFTKQVHFNIWYFYWLIVIYLYLLQIFDIFTAQPLLLRSFLSVCTTSYLSILTVLLMMCFIWYYVCSRHDMAEILPTRRWTPINQSIKTSSYGLKRCDFIRT